ncbi:hypothetical protein HZA85_04070 [Candidatus Uhrbacteria bacterium]|nr:hypothetical protein [Candidatus Uhrbacteria bacterium]
MDDQHPFRLGGDVAFGEYDSFGQIRLAVVKTEGEGHRAGDLAQYALDPRSQTVFVGHEDVAVPEVSVWDGRLLAVFAQEGLVVPLKRCRFLGISSASAVELPQEHLVAGTREAARAFGVAFSRLQHPFAFLLERDEEVTRKPTLQRDHLVV